LGYTVPGGAWHDFTLLKSEFPNEVSWFRDFKVWLDSGYQGFKKKYQTVQTEIPIKKPRKSKKNPNPSLTDAQKEYNREVSRNRIFVENAIGRMKRYNILNQKFRNRKENFADEVIELCEGLANLKIKYKQPKY
jgi:hypothetical protein